MPAGIQVFDGSGNVILDISDDTAKFGGTISIPASDGTNTQTGNVTNSALSLGQVWWVANLPSSSVYTESVSVTVSGSTLTWVSQKDTPACTIFYGVI